MNYKSFLLITLCLFCTTANRCINNHCHQQEADCKSDSASLPCLNIINICLDQCSSNQSYACILLCVSGRKNDHANKFVNCCAEYRCKVEKFTALLGENMVGNIAQHA